MCPIGEGPTILMQQTQLFCRSNRSPVELENLLLLRRSYDISKNTTQIFYHIQVHQVGFAIVCLWCVFVRVCYLVLVLGSVSVPARVV
jgi:hypothetical protein